MFPSAFAETERDTEEERRLFYVAITRAEQQVFVSYARQRFRNGQITFSNPSRFLKDMDEQYLDRSGEHRSTPQRWSIWDEEERTARYENTSRFSDRPSFSQPTTTRSPGRFQKTTGMQPKTDKEDIDCGYESGSRIRHNTFGEGTVKKCFRENGNDKIVIDFDKVGEKTLLLKFARLEKI